MEYKTIAVLLLLKLSRFVCGSGTYIIKKISTTYFVLSFFCIIFVFTFLVA